MSGPQFHHRCLASKSQFHADPTGPRRPRREEAFLRDRIGEGIEIADPAGFIVRIEDIINPAPELHMLASLDAGMEIHHHIVAYGVERIAIIAAQELIGGIDEVPSKREGAGYGPIEAELEIVPRDPRQAVAWLD